MPNEFDFDFPIVQLEDDSPQAIGKVGLFDMFIRVGNTGITFVAALAGTLQSYGPVFPAASTASATLRAASSLCQWGLISGDIFAFERGAINLAQTDVSTILSVPLATVQAWEAGTISIPRLMWQEIAARVCAADQRSLPPELQLLSPPASYRGRIIRIFPNGPVPSSATSTVSCPCPEPVPNCPPVVG